MAFRAGIYNWTYQGGNFLVAFRPRGVFYCEKFPAAASWSNSGNVLTVDWKKFGVYEFPFRGDNNVSLDGYVQNNRENWRKVEFVRDFNAVELALLGEGYGTAWNFIWEKGSFEIEFRVDGFNHFVCKQYPAHSHWKLVNDEVVEINWGQFGEYLMSYNANTHEMSGYKKDQPANWRRATLARVLGEDSLGSVPSHDHAHEHKHGESCSGHGHGHGKCGGHGDHHHDDEDKCCDDKECGSKGGCSGHKH